jgi:hypothetical protein
MPPKLISLIKLTLENTTANVKVNNECTEEFRVESGVKNLIHSIRHYSVWWSIQN